MRRLLVVIMVLSTLLFLSCGRIENTSKLEENNSPEVLKSEADSKIPSSQAKSLEQANNPESIEQKFADGDLYIKALATKNPKICNDILDEALRTMCKKETQ